MVTEMNLFKVNGKFDLKKLIVSFLVTFVTALIGTIASIGAKEYYSTLNQPAFAPPGAVFAYGNRCIPHLVIRAILSRCQTRFNIISYSTDLKFHMEHIVFRCKKYFFSFD